MDIPKRGQDAGEKDLPADDRHGLAALCRCSDAAHDQDPNVMKNLHAILCQSLLFFERIVKPFESWNEGTFIPDEGWSPSRNPEGEGLR